MEFGFLINMLVLSSLGCLKMLRSGAIFILMSAKSYVWELFNIFSKIKKLKFKKNMFSKFSSCILMRFIGSLSLPVVVTFASLWIGAPQNLNSWAKLLIRYVEIVLLKMDWVEVGVVWYCFHVIHSYLDFVVFGDLRCWDSIVFVCIS